MNEHSHAADREIRIVRVFDAPRTQVFKAWTTEEHTGQWMGPDGFTTTTASMDVRPGGQWRYVMHGPDGTDYENLVTYREVTPPRRLVYAHGANEDDPEQFLVTVRFEDEGGKTRVEMQMLFATPEDRKRVAEEYGAIEGANQTMNRLAAYLETMGASDG